MQFIPLNIPVTPIESGQEYVAVALYVEVQTDPSQVYPSGQTAKGAVGSTQLFEVMLYVPVLQIGADSHWLVLALYVVHSGQSSGVFSQRWRDPTQEYPIGQMSAVTATRHLLCPVSYERPEGHSGAASHWLAAAL